MSKHKHKKHKPKTKNKSDWHPTSDADRDEAHLIEIEKQLDTLTDPNETSSPGPIWGAIHKLLLKTSADPVQIVHIITQRETDTLSKLIQNLRDGTPLDPTPQPAANQPDPSNQTQDSQENIPPEILKKALRAFRKRLKLTRLDHESRLGVGPMSSGRTADFDIIMAPYEFPTEVWETLVKQGKLEQMGPGFYKLTDQ